IHTEVGHRTVGARVNGRLVALESTLDNGDTVEIFTTKAPEAGPSRDWLKFVQSPRAKNKIRQWFSKERREAAVDAGKDQPAKAPQPRKTGDSGVEVDGAPDVWVRLSRCCTPVPGDPIIGFVTHGHGVSVHRTDCSNLAHLTEVQRERMVDVHWAPTDGSVF